MDLVNQKDVVYLVAGLAFFGLTFLPTMLGPKPVGVPVLYVAAGAALALVPVGVPLVDPRQGEFARALVEHAAELIVIVALMGAGLAVDRREGLFAWRHAWLLLGVTMPFSIVAVAGAAWWLAGLPLASAALLAAALAPTDPVLARSVQVGAPMQGGEDDVRVALTTESGLNDGLAFPFVHLAILLAGLALTKPLSEPGAPLANELLAWAGFDLVYRIAAALALGWLGGQLISRFVHGPYGDAGLGGENPALVMLGATFLLYGATEAIDGYGFLAVFVGARAARAWTRDAPAAEYVPRPHHFSDQLEKILLALMLLWLGAFAASGLLDATSWAEIGVVAAVVFVIRPVAGGIAMLPVSGPRLQRAAIAVLGIRGFGTVFYIAYALGEASFAGADAIWRIAVLCILASIVVHGAIAPALTARAAALAAR